MLKLDLGCGTRKTKSQDEFPFLGVDKLGFDQVDLICDLAEPTWVFKTLEYVPEFGESLPLGNWRFQDNSVDEVFCSHFLEHLSGQERVLFFNELYRVLKPGARALMITPDWSHACAYGDPTHKWPPVSSWYALYLNKAWRDINAPHVTFTCDFDWTHAVAWEEWLNSRNNETKTFALQHYINSTRDLHITLTKRGETK
jgi:hypothetical protein